MKTLLKCAEIVIALTRSISSPYNSDRERCTHLSYKLHIYIYIYIYICIYYTCKQLHASTLRESKDCGKMVPI